MGRFMTADPLASSASGNDPGSLNRYAYVGGDPANRVDPSVTDDCSPGDTLPCSTTVNDPGDPAGGGGGGGSSSGGGTSTSAPCHGYGAAYAACMQQWAAQQALMNQWNSLSGTCQQGLLWAVPSTSISGVLAALGRATAAQSTLQAATAGTSISWEMLAAIGIRESGFQNKPQANGGPGQGIFQITVPGSGLTAAQAGNLTTAATWAANFLNNDMAYLAAKFPGFTPAQLLQATAASYNLGPHGITGNPATIDKGSAPAPKAEGNYGSNILQLMTCFQ